MGARLVLVIGARGIQLVRMYVSSYREEEEAINLFLKVRKNLWSIDRALASKCGSQNSAKQEEMEE